MKFIRSTAIAAGLTFAVAGLSYAGTAAAPAAAQAGTTDWTKRVAKSDMGGFVIGSPIAKHKLVEYVSYSCSHCAEFEKVGAPALKREFVAKGNVSIEIRNYARNPFDLAAGLLARCGGPGKFVAIHSDILGSQSGWLAKAGQADQATLTRWNQGELPQRLLTISGDVGLLEIAASHGINRAKATQCLASKADTDAIIAQTRFAANDAKIEGTPGFTLNGTLLSKTYDWTRLRQKLSTL